MRFNTIQNDGANPKIHAKFNINLLAWKKNIELNSGILSGEYFLNRSFCYFAKESVTSVNLLQVLKIYQVCFEYKYKIISSLTFEIN